VQEYDGFPFVTPVSFKTVGGCPAQKKPCVTSI